MPKVSVVITCYNYGKYVSGCLDSVLGQTFQDFEIIVVNDGSTDDTDKIIINYLDNPKIKYIRQENKGQACAKNVGIKNSSGEYIAFLDADDKWVNTKLDEQLPLFNNPRVGVIYSNARYIDEGGKEIHFRLEPFYLKPRAGMVTNWLLFDNFIPFSSSVVRRSCFDRVGIFDESIKMGIDWDLWLRISVDYLFMHVDKPLLIYRLGHSGQMSKNLEVRQHCSDMILKKFESTNPDLTPPKLMRRVAHYTFMNRGEYFRKVNLTKSSKYFIMAFYKWPASLGPCIGLIKNALYLFAKNRL